MPDLPAKQHIRHTSATVHGRFLVAPPAARPMPPRALWIVGFHGYAQNADVMLEPFAAMAPSDQWLTASVQALHPFYASRTQEVIANWMTSQDRELAIADNIGYINNVCDALQREYGAPRVIVFAGFSQGVAMAYRAALAGARPAAAIIAAGGDVPPEFTAADSPHLQHVWPQVLAVTGTRDEWFTPERLARDVAFLRTHQPATRELVFDGGHEWSPALIAEARTLLAQIEATAPA